MHVYCASTVYSPPPFLISLQDAFFVTRTQATPYLSLRRKGKEPYLAGRWVFLALLSLLSVTCWVVAYLGFNLLGCSVVLVLIGLSFLSVYFFFVQLLISFVFVIRLLACLCNDVVCLCLFVYVSLDSSFYLYLSIFFLSLSHLFAFIFLLPKLIQWMH